MKNTSDDYRAMMDLVGIKLKDQDSAFEMIKLSLSNSAKFNLSKPNVFKSDSESLTKLKKIAGESIADRRQKLDHELCLMLRDRFHLAPGDIREQFDGCWLKCFSQAFEKHNNSSPLTKGMLTALAFVPVFREVSSLVAVGSKVYDRQLINIVSEAWKEYLDGVRCIIDKCWSEDNRE